ncbi:AAA family ATPase [Haloarcula onubensis]|uniref:AAA family ATPase n=1 Tax=Haloarcula onubensis TaxID=2950539 RepID=A0ABU2FT73_9EURY|nr:AAA family ATPase [Halomicroarcula sp. S3CR25-11]MDS0283963.1 AAA family ATPase [Halomicroarcula sp. S3CR25-11]
MTDSTSLDHLLAELDRIEVLLQGFQDPTPDSANADSTARASEPATLTPTLPDAVQSELDAVTASIETVRERARADELSRLAHLVDAFDLSAAHRDILLLALLPDVEQEHATRFRDLHEELAVDRPTVGLIADLFGDTTGQRLVATELLGDDSPLVRYDLVTLDDPPSGHTSWLTHPVRVTDRIRAYLFDHDNLDSLLEAGLTAANSTESGIDNLLEQHRADRALEALAIGDDLRERLDGIRTASSGPTRNYWYGPEGSEKHDAVEAVCDAEWYLRADLDAVVAADALNRLVREATLLDCPVHLSAATEAITDRSDRDVTLEAIFEQFEQFQNDLYITGTDAWTPTGTTLDLDAIVAFPRPSIDLRREFWNDHADELPGYLDPEVLASTFELTQGQLEAALATARSLADGDPSAEDIRAGCRAQSADGLDELSQQIDPASDWDDIHLREKAERELELVREHIARRARVYSEWGFAEKFSRGTGVVALFKGKSGTGKTMAAEVLANDVGMDLYKIDLSSVISKYIGETEENLERIFEAAEQSNAILLFDEADSIFGDRAEVSDATDRYANVEVNYLLQRIESYDGVVLLTTNYATNIDDAFQRRIDHTISFREPKEDTRDAIWRGIFPDAAPTEDIDYDLLAQLDLTGGQIKSVGQTTAVLAAADGDMIEMEHVVRALEREFGTHSKTLGDVDFGAYAKHFQSQHGRTALGSEPDTDESDKEPVSDRSPEEVVEQFIELLDDGDGERAHELYHSGALLDELGYKERQVIAQGDLSIAGEVERLREDGDKVVVRFDWQLNGRRTTKAYELRTDKEGDGGWRIFNNRERLTTRR